MPCSCTEDGGERQASLHIGLQAQRASVTADFSHNGLQSQRASVTTAFSHNGLEAMAVVSRWEASDEAASAVGKESVDGRMGRYSVWDDVCWLRVVQVRLLELAR